MHQFIRPQAVLNAVNWLIRNKLYCGQDVDAEWHNLCFDEVAEKKTTAILPNQHKPFLDTKTKPKLTLLMLN